jgi:hypothetical protein
VDAAAASPQVFTSNVSGMLALRWVDGSHLAYIAQFGSWGWALYRQALGSAPQSVANGLTAQASFDERP